MSLRCSFKNGYALTISHSSFLHCKLYFRRLFPFSNATTFNFCSPDTIIIFNTSRTLRTPTRSTTSFPVAAVGASTLTFQKGRKFWLNVVLFSTTSVKLMASATSSLPQPRQLWRTSTSTVTLFTRTLEESRQSNLLDAPYKSRINLHKDSQSFRKCR